LQGDIVAVYSNAGTKLISYTYDAWGNCTVAYENGGDSCMARYNPFRYRGYYYDSETGFYYLNSRYYDPVVGRFITADTAIADVGSSLHGYNMFSYCFNNPVMCVDYDGDWPDWNKFVTGALAVTIGALTVAAVVATGGACAPLVTAGYYAVAAAGTVFAATGASEVVESFTGQNPLENAVGEDTYQLLHDGSAAVISMSPAIIEIGSMSVCFVAGTEIATEYGQIPIEKVTAGMLVYATDPETGETGIKPVVQTFVNETDQLVHLEVNGETITTTPEHPFWVPQKGWTSACKLRAGDMLQLLNGEYVVLEAVQHEILESPVTVYNFEVEDYHTYYVGSDDILVHNMCGDDLFERFNNHAFSKDHIKKGILDLGLSRRGLFDYVYGEALKRMTQAQEKSNQFYTQIGNTILTVRFYVENGQVININAMVGEAKDIIGKLLD